MKANTKLKVVATAEIYHTILILLILIQWPAVQVGGVVLQLHTTQLMTMMMIVCVFRANEQQTLKKSVKAQIWH